MKGSKAEAAWDEAGVPPVAFCIYCGLESCPGCDGAAATALGQLAWEDSPSNWLMRLWQTSLASSLEPQRTFGELPPGPIAPALSFALLAETLALGSLAALGAAGLKLGAPRFAEQLLGSRAALLALAALFAASVSMMLGLHALWGICLDVGAGRRTHRHSWARGLRFGLYACGWDLVTSPFGLACALLTRGPVRAWAALSAAAHAPRIAQRAYLEVCRGFGVEARQRAVKLSMAVLGAAMALVAMTLIAAILMVARRYGY